MANIDPLAFIKAANAKSKQRRSNGDAAIAAALQQGSMVNGDFDGPVPMAGSGLAVPKHAGRLLMPLAGNLHVTSNYGPRTHPIKGSSGFHTGVDYGAKAGTPVYAISNGVVRKATPNGGAYGNQVVVDVGGGLEGMYGHLSRFIVQPGQRVRKGQVIGYVGSTGLSTGPHLHFETWYKGKPVNPGKYL